MGDKDGLAALKESGLNHSWFARYEATCKKYSSKTKSKHGATSPAPLIERPSSEAPVRKRRPQEREGGEKLSLPRVKPAKSVRGKTFEVRFCNFVPKTDDPYHPQVRAMSSASQQPVKRIDALHQMYVACCTSGSISEADAGTFHRIMVGLHQPDRSINDRLFELIDTERNKTISFEAFCRIVLFFKNGNREEQARLLFQIIDTSDDGSLDKCELLKFFCNVRDRNRKRMMGDVVNELMKMIKQDESGDIRIREFAEATADDEVWMLIEAINPFAALVEKFDSLICAHDTPSFDQEDTHLPDVDPGASA